MSVRSSDEYEVTLRVNIEHSVKLHSHMSLIFDACMTSHSLALSISHICNAHLLSLSLSNLLIHLIAHNFTFQRQQSHCLYHPSYTPHLSPPISFHNSNHDQHQPPSHPSPKHQRHHPRNRRLSNTNLRPHLKHLRPPQRLPRLRRRPVPPTRRSKPLLHARGRRPTPMSDLRLVRQERSAHWG